MSRNPLQPPLGMRVSNYVDIWRHMQLYLVFLVSHTKLRHQRQLSAAPLHQVFTASVWNYWDFCERFKKADRRQITCFHVWAKGRTLGKHSYLTAKLFPQHDVIFWTGEKQPLCSLRRFIAAEKSWTLYMSLCYNNMDNIQPLHFKTEYDKKNK